MDIDSVHLTGQRVELIPLTPEHTEELYGAGSSAEIWRYSASRIETMQMDRQIA